MPRKLPCQIILLAILFATMSIEPAFSISVGYRSSDGHGAVSVSESYALDTSTSLNSNVVLAGNEVSQIRHVSGSGNNELKQEVSGERYSIANSISSSGDLSSSSSVGASSTSASLGHSISGSGETTIGQSVSTDGSTIGGSVSSQGLLNAYSSSSASSSEANLNQEVLGGGNIALAVTGTTGQDNSVQKASVEDGMIASSQSASVGAGVSASQRTAISGETGSLGSGVVSPDNSMMVSGSFIGRGSLSAELKTDAADQASTHGKYSVNGGTLIDDSNLNQVQSDSIGLKVEGQRILPEGDVGSFEVNVVNMACKDGCSDGKNNNPSQDSYKLLTGSINGGQTLPIKWTQNNPLIQLYLVGSTVPSNLDKEEVSSAISKAANIWDDAVAQDLFADKTTVKIDDSKQVVPADATQPDGFNTQGWRQLSSKENADGKTSAISYTWFGNQIVDGYYSIQEADTAYNSALPWSTTGGKYDVESVALHELGHGIGLDDVKDSNQVMNKCYEFRRGLGNGDIKGAQVLYGKPGTQVGLVPLYRLYNPTIYDHFYTTNSNLERPTSDGYLFEGIAGYIYDNSQPGTVALNRLYNPTVYDHFYTTNSNLERHTSDGYLFEGIQGYIFPDSPSGTVPFYRLYNPTITDHFYTTNLAEAQNAESNLGYIFEGTAGNILSTQ